MGKHVGLDRPRLSFTKRLEAGTNKLQNKLGGGSGSIERSGGFSKGGSLQFGDQSFDVTKPGGGKVSKGLEKLLGKLPGKTWEGQFEKGVAAKRGSGSVGSADGKFAAQGSYSLAEASVRGRGSVTIKGGALKAEGELQAQATLVAVQGAARAKLGALEADVAGYAYVGAKASAKGSLIIDPKTGTYAASLGGEAFLGARAGVSGEAKLGKYGSIGGSAEAWAGVGATFKLDAGFSKGKFKFKADIGAALGIGFKLGINFSIDFNKIKDVAKKVLEAPLNIIKSVGSAAKSFIKKLKFW
ncbi:MAG: hypothetical protein ACYC8T_22825 [Myxococcaceae bacterium]